MTTVSVGPAFRSGVPALVLVSFLLLFPFVLGTTISLDALPLPLLALHIYLSVRLAVVATSLNPRLITLMFLLFHYWFFSVVPIHQLSAGRFPEPTSYSSGQLLEVTIYVLVSIVAFDIFASLALRHRQFRLRHIGTALSAQIQRRLLVLGIIATASAAATFGLALVVSGSRDELSRAIQTSGLRLGPGLTAALLLQTVYRVPIFVSVLIVADAARRSGKVAVSRPLLVVSSLALAISISPLNTPRYWTATVLLAFLFVLWPPLTAARRTALVAFALFGLLLVFPVSDAFRHEVSPSAITDEISRSLQDPWASRDWDAFQTTLDASIHRRELNLGPGENLVGAALFWFPRAMWETKPQPTGPLVASAAGGGWVGSSCGRRTLRDGCGCFNRSSPRMRPSFFGGR